MNRQTDLYNTATGGLKSAGTEMALDVLAYNIKQMISLIDIQRLMRAIQG